MSGALVAVEANRFLALDETSRQVRALKANARFSPIKESDLIRVKNPSGGATAWEVNAASGVKYEQKLTGVIVYLTARRTLWADRTPGTGERPVCSSNDLYHGKPRKTDEGVLDIPANIKALGMPGGETGTCDQCYFNQWGTGVNAQGQKTRGKLCQESRTMFFLPENAILPLRMSVPAGSLALFDRWMKQLSNEGCCFNECLVELHLEKDKAESGADFAQVVPKFLGPLSDDAIGRLGEYAKLLTATFERAADVDATSRPAAAAKPAGTEDVYGFGSPIDEGAPADAK